MRSLTQRTAITALGVSALLYGRLALAAGPSTTSTPVQATERSRVTYDSYILGPGDSLQIELLNIPELSGTFSIGPDGTIYLPRLRALYVEGLTVEELRYFLTEQFKTYVKNPQLYVRPVGYRPIRIYVGGEVRRPGYYTLSGLQSNELSSIEEVDQQQIGPQRASTGSTTDLALQETLIQSRSRFGSGRGAGGEDSGSAEGLGEV